MPKKITTESFIKKANEVHPGKYDYSKTIYVKAKNKVCIICPVHGEFYQMPYKHLSGKGCILCGYEQQKQTNIEKYGTPCSLQNDAVKQKSRNTLLGKYGVSNPMESEEIKQKQRMSVKQHYGVENSMQSEEVKEKCRATCLLRYGTEHPLSSDIVRDKIISTNMHRYGVPNPMQNNEIKKRWADNFYAAYGTYNPMHVPEFVEKLKETDMLIYGMEYHICSDLVKDKSLRTVQRRYGVSNVMHDAGVRDKKHRTNKERYGGDSPFCSPEVQRKARGTITSRYGCENVSGLEEVKQKIRDSKRINGTFHTSSPEDALYEMLAGKFGTDDVIRQYRSEEYPFACDFYIKSMDTYIELNASWLHGGHFFNKDDVRDAEKLYRWESLCDEHPLYKSAIETWTVRDVKKHMTAKKNKINYVVFWDNDLSDAKRWLNNN